MAASRTLLVLALAFAGAGCPAFRLQTPEALRRTPLVQAFDRCKDSVVKFTATRVEHTEKPAPDGKGSTRVHTTHTQWGSGCILHPAGYVLTNSHMLQFQGRRVALLYDGRTCGVELVADDPHNDLAVMKLASDRPLRPITLGDSSRALIGEPVFTIGNPFGISFTVAAGIISGLERSTNTEYAALNNMIQTDASINPGTSGGPLVNLAGEMIGLCTSNKKEAENIGFAISINKVRAAFADLIAAEGRYGFVLGLEVAHDGVARITHVAAGSPAEAAGLCVGDVVTGIGDAAIANNVDFHLALVGRKGGETLPLTIRRHGRRLQVAVTLRGVPARPADRAEGLVPGVVWRQYAGSWKTLPEFAKLTPAAVGTMPALGLGGFAGKENFALELTGYVQAPADGVYAFYLRSDDGSRLYIGEQLVVDHDGLHASSEKRGFVRLAAGKHPLRVQFFQGTGDAELKVSYEGPGIRKQEIPAAALSRPGP
ncbi:MAG TPA: trypsin-like peptidase domain-containing protein [Planctomycetota bacterium]|nr:trypsin-like peptidase domain-containing protein [Planctomycetota bacterium]HRR80288.1 trypsin-like peptidase domain-containing protein [Planctomycetota bacterium]HRT95930.1 trypsin-like peptidase domain-containing protein [Planctomycetota bacterium]